MDRFNVDVGCLEIMMMMFLVEVWIIFLVRQNNTHVAILEKNKESRNAPTTNDAPKSSTTVTTRTAIISIINTASISGTNANDRRTT